MSTTAEPTEAFPHTSPTEEIESKYDHILSLYQGLPPLFFETLFDKVVAIFLITVSLPILLLLEIAYVIEGISKPKKKGPSFFYYWGVSGGKKMKKWKIRLIKTKYTESGGAKRHDWIAFSPEWTPNSRTHVGEFARK